MSWRSEAEAVLGLTRAAREALGRGDVETLEALLEERGVRVRRLGDAAGPPPGPPEMIAALAGIKAEEEALASDLRARLAETGQALGRLATLPAGAGGMIVPTCDRRA